MIVCFTGIWGTLIEDFYMLVMCVNYLQIISPNDKGIAKHIDQNLEPWPTSWDTSIVESSALKTDPYQEINTMYNNDLQAKCNHR